MREKFKKFAASDFKLEIWDGNKLIFKSKDDKINGFLEFIKNNNHGFADLTIFDTIVGNAVALLAVYLKSKKVYGIIGSASAVATFDEFNIKYNFLKIIPEVFNKNETDICPLEKLSFSKTPEEFYNLIKTNLNLI